jgi:hypothetical protein
VNGMCDGEEHNMATETIYKRFSINKKEAEAIVSSPRSLIKRTNIFSDVKLTESEKINLAKRVLKSRKCK